MKTTKIKTFTVNENIRGGAMSWVTQKVYRNELWNTRIDYIKSIGYVSWSDVFYLIHLYITTVASNRGKVRIITSMLCHYMF